jgi:dTDP-4-dehydrorhamnose 3,5-epimerase-like enzyme
MALATLKNVSEIEFPHRPSPEASLFVYEQQSHVPFPIKRVFVVTADEACERGSHAHKECTQLLVCLKGSVELTLHDGASVKTVMMNDAKKGILIPPGIWGEQQYEQGSIMMALADQPYNEAEYIRDYDTFLSYRKVGT